MGKLLFKVFNLKNFPVSVDDVSISPGKSVAITNISNEISNALSNALSKGYISIVPISPESDSNVSLTDPGQITDSTGGSTLADVPAFNATTYTASELNDFAATLLDRVNTLTTQVQQLAAFVNAITTGGVPLDSQVKNLSSDK